MDTKRMIVYLICSVLASASGAAAAVLGGGGDWNAAGMAAAGTVLPTALAAWQTFKADPKKRDEGGL